MVASILMSRLYSLRSVSLFVYASRQFLNFTLNIKSCGCLIELSPAYIALIHYISSHIKRLYAFFMLK